MDRVKSIGKVKQVLSGAWNETGTVPCQTPDIIGTAVARQRSAARTFVTIAKGLEGKLKPDLVYFGSYRRCDVVTTSIGRQWIYAPSWVII